MSGSGEKLASNTTILNTACRPLINGHKTILVTKLTLWLQSHNKAQVVGVDVIFTVIFSNQFKLTHQQSNDIYWKIKDSKYLKQVDFKIEYL